MNRVEEIFRKIDKACLSFWFGYVPGLLYGVTSLAMLWCIVGLVRLFQWGLNAKYKVAICRNTHEGSHRSEVANFVSHAWRQRFTDPKLSEKIDELIDVPIQYTPADVALNLLVETCQLNRVDFMFVVDGAASPRQEFFKVAFDYLSRASTPSVLGCPWMNAKGEIEVYRLAREHTSDPEFVLVGLERYSRAEAFTRTGIEQAASIGVNCIAYDMRVFGKIKQPYYQFAYNENHTDVLESPEMALHRRLIESGVPISVHWGLWSGAGLITSSPRCTPFGRIKYHSLGNNKKENYGRTKRRIRRNEIL